MPRKLALTHFLCLPLVTSASRPQWQASLQKLENDVASSPSLQNLRFGACRPLGTLHLTFGLLSLETGERKHAACDLLRSSGVRSVAHGKIDSSRTASVTSSDINQPSNPTPAKSSEVSAIEQQTLDLDPAVSPYSITLSGLHSMGSPSSTTVLYALPEDPASRLHNMCTAIRDVFESADLLVHEDRPLLLHATIINTIYNRPQGHSDKNGESQVHGLSNRRLNRRPKRFEATELIEKYAQFEWAKDFRVEKVSICKMGAEKIMEGGIQVDCEYSELCHVDLP